MATNHPSQLSRRRLLQVMGAAGLGVAAGGVGMAARAAQAATTSPITFGVGPFDRALNTLAERGYSLQSAGLAVTDSGSILVDGTERTRRVLYNYADRVGPYVDYLGEVATARAEGRDYRTDGLLRAREDFHIYTAPVPDARFYGLQRPWREGERFGFSVLPNWDHGPWYGRPWPVGGDFWGLVYVLDPRGVPWVWLIASTAEYRAISPTGASTAVRTEVVAQRTGPGQWMEYRAERAVLSVSLRRASDEFFVYPTWL